MRTAAPPDFKRLHVFFALCEELSFSLTAERTSLTPSRVSQAIRTLEQEVGGRLFDRTSRRVTLTPLGRQLRDSAEPAYLQLCRAYDATRQMTGTRVSILRLGMYTPANAGPRLLEIVRNFESARPGCVVRTIDTGLVEEAVALLHRGEVDLIAQRLPVSDPDVTIGPVLTREARILAISESHPLSACESIEYEDLAGYAVCETAGVRQETLDGVIPPRTPSGRRLRRVRVQSFTEVMMRVAEGEIVHPTVASFLDYYKHPGVVARPIRDLPPSETALMWSAGTDDPRVTAFARVARDTIQST